MTSLPGVELNRLQKEIISTFKSHGLQITVEAGMKITDFLDVSFNLLKNTYRPFKKDNQTPVYIHKQSNHPPHVKKELPKMISSRISKLSSNEEIFKMEAPTYNAALKNAGFNEKIEFVKDKSPAKRKNRKRKIIWFNPPWNDAVSTNVARKFLLLIDKHFSNHMLFKKHFNRNTIKVSYSCMPNMKSIIAGHNKKAMGRDKTTKIDGCNCRKDTIGCILGGKCLTKGLVYKCSVKSDSEVKEYIGLSATSFKDRYSSHKASFRHPDKKHSTALSHYIWV